MKKNSVESISYDYFNFWVARLISPIINLSKIEYKINNQLVDGCEKILNNFKNENSVEKLNGEEKITQRKKHVRFPTFLLKGKYLIEGLPDIACKIRVNPCILRDESDEVHTKIWAIFFNLNQSKKKSDDLIKISKKLRGFSEKIFDEIQALIRGIVGKIELDNDKYYITMFNASIHPDDTKIYEKELYDFYLSKEVKHLIQNANKNPITNSILIDLLKINDVKDFSKISKHIKYEKDKAGIKLVNSRLYDSLSRIYSTKGKTSIAGISFINSEKDRRDLLYREPRLKALDFSIKL